MELTQQKMAEILGITPRNLRDLNAPRLVGKNGKAGLYNAKEVVKWYIAREVAKHIPDSDDNDALERYRRLKGDETELKLKVTRGELIPAADVEHCFAAIASIWTRVARRLQRKGMPPEAWEIVSNELTSARDLYESSLQVHIEDDLDDDLDLKLTPKPNGEPKRKKKLKPKSKPKPKQNGNQKK